MTCDHMFSDPKLDYTFHVICLCNWIISYLFLYVVISHLLRIREGVGTHYKLITEWIELAQDRILFCDQ